MYGNVQHYLEQLVTDIQSAGLQKCERIIAGLQCAKPCFASSGPEGPRHGLAIVALTTP